MSRSWPSSFTIHVIACLLAACAVPSASAGEKNSRRYDEQPPAHVTSPVESLPAAERSTAATKRGATENEKVQATLESPSVRGEPLPRSTSDHVARVVTGRPPAAAENAAGHWVWVPDGGEPFDARFFVAGPSKPRTFFQPFQGVRQAGGPLFTAIPGQCVICQHEQAADLSEVCPCTNGECADECCPPLDPSESAGQVLDVMRRVGPSVLEGSLFQEAHTDDCAFGGCTCPTGCQCPACNGQGRCACGTEADDRLSLIRILRRLEAQEQAECGGCQECVAGHASCNCTDRDCAHAAAHRVASSVVDTDSELEDSIDILRETSFELEIAAHRLESENLYFRADQLREMAGQLRQEARSALAGWSAPRQRATAKEQPLGAQRDLGLELEQLRDELRRVREALNVPGAAGHPIR